MRHLPLCLPLIAGPLATLAATQTMDDARLRSEVFVSGLARPVCMTFAGPRNALVFTNSSGRVYHLMDGLPVNVALDLEVSFQGARGIVADPDFATNRHVYLYYGVSNTGDGGAWVETHVMRYTFDGLNLHSPVGPLFTVPFDAAQANPDAYNAGILRFGPDGHLYGQVGDKGRGSLSNPRIETNTGNSASALAGAIFRIATDGSIPADNPFVGLANANLHPWYSYGFRNSLGMDFDPRSGELWFGDNSPADYDEINRGGPGMNSGWMLIFGPDSRDISYSYNNSTPADADDLVMLPGAYYRDPEFSFKDAIGITAVQFIASKRFPEDLQDTLLVGDSNFGELFGFELDSARTGLVLSGALADRVADDSAERDSLRVGSGWGNVTDIITGPDGYLYIVSISNSSVYRVRPVVDLVEPGSLQVLQGTVLSGGLPELERSDDQRLVLREPAPAGPSQRHALEAVFTLNDASPLRLDLVVEASANRDTLQRVQLYHVPSDGWVTLAVDSLTAADSVVRVDDLPLPEEYVDPTTREVRLRVVHHAQAQARRGAKLANAKPLASRIDQLRLLATLP